MSKDNRDMSINTALQKGVSGLKKGVYILAESAGVIQGFIASVTDLWEAYIVALAVKKEARGKGIGSFLLKACMERLKGMGVKNVYGDVLTSSDSIDFWVKEGFEKGNTAQFIWKEL